MYDSELAHNNYIKRRNRKYWEHLSHIIMGNIVENNGCSWDEAQSIYNSQMRGLYKLRNED
jgi:hypothetical protein